MTDLATFVSVGVGVGFIVRLMVWGLAGQVRLWMGLVKSDI